MTNDSSRQTRLDRTLGWARLPLLVAVLCAAGCPAPPAPQPEEGVTDVRMLGIAFLPREVTIKVGDTVRWSNLEIAAIVHTSTSGDPDDGNAGDLWDSGNMSPGDIFTHQFDEAGEFEYYCIPHVNVDAMRRARVIVEP